MSSLTGNGWLSNNSNDRMVIAIIVASVIHAVIILGVSFGVIEPRDDSIPPNIEVTLVNTASDKKPEQADYYAQENQEGGGNTTDRIRPETLAPSVFPDPQARMATQAPNMLSQAQTEQAQKQVMTASMSKHSVAVQEKTVDDQQSESLSTIELISRAMEIASLEAEIGESIRAYANMPRRKFISAATAKHKDAAYLEYWRRKIESIGNNYMPPEITRRNLSGELTMVVSLRKNGTIEFIRIQRSSGSDILDDTAKRIVHLGAPYTPPPAEVLDGNDVIQITRTWKFLGGGVSTR